MKTLVLQRGHVPRTRGATGAPGEQAMARRVAAAVAALMPHAGWQLSIIDADEPSHRYRGDAFISLHGDAHANPGIGGASVGYRTDAGRQLAARWKDAYTRHGWPFAWRDDNYTAALSGYYGHRLAVAQGTTAAVIVEHGFMTNPDERAWIDSTDGTRAAALAVVEAVTGSIPGHQNDPAPEAEMIVTIEGEGTTAWQVVGGALVEIPDRATAELIGGEGWGRRAVKLTASQARRFRRIDADDLWAAARLRQGAESVGSTPLGVGEQSPLAVRYLRDQGADLDPYRDPTYTAD